MKRGEDEKIGDGCQAGSGKFIGMRECSRRINNQAASAGSETCQPVDGRLKAAKTRSKYEQGIQEQQGGGKQEEH